MERLLGIVIDPEVVQMGSKPIGIEKSKSRSVYDRGRMTGITGQSLPILVPLLTIDVLWSDLHMVHEGRSLMSYDSFYYTFRSA
jgi:hypothetical protein